MPPGNTFTINAAFLKLSNSVPNRDSLQQLLLDLAHLKRIRHIWSIDCLEGHRKTAHSYSEFCKILKTKKCQICDEGFDNSSVGNYFSILSNSIQVVTK